MWSADTDERRSVARICVTLLNLLVGFLFLSRAPLRQHGTVLACALALPSFVAGGVAFRLSPRLEDWMLHAELLFIAGTAFTAASLLYLGRSFAILPARREIVSRGTYRLMRHPVYAGELILMIAMFSAGPTWLTSVPLLAAIPLIVVRILAEERLLRNDDAYLHYSSQVGWRLLPGVW